MDSNNDLQKRLAIEFEMEEMPSLDDFLRELEEKEKDLKMSSEIIIEVEEGENEDKISHESPAPEPPELIFEEPKPAVELPVSKPEQNGHHEVVALRLQIGRLENELKEMQTTLSRRQADFDNYRKRIEREKGDSFVEQIGNLATQLLPALDNLNRALDAATNLSGDQSKNFQHLFDGIVLVNHQLNEILAEMGIEPIPSVGEDFDPHVHDAVAAEESSEYSPHTVTAEFLRGYRIGERIIRPAMVKVAAPASSKVLAATEETE